METKEMLEALIRQTIQSLDEGNTEDAKYSVDDICDLVKAWCEIEKLDAQKEDQLRKFREDCRTRDLDRTYRDTLEREKLAEDIRLREQEMNEKYKFEREKLNAEFTAKLAEVKSKEKADAENLKQKKKNDQAGAWIQIGGIMIPLIAYCAFLMVAMRLEYMDHGSVTGFTAKELFKRMIPIRI